MKEGRRKQTNKASEYIQDIKIRAEKRNKRMKLK
jgi:hypothetical protein